MASHSSNKRCRWRSWYWKYTGIIKLYVDGVLTSTVTGTPNGTEWTQADSMEKSEFGRGGGNTGKFVGEFGPIRIFAMN